MSGVNSGSESSVNCDGKSSTIFERAESWLRDIKDQARAGEEGLREEAGLDIALNETV